MTGNMRLIKSRLLRNFLTATIVNLIAFPGLWEVLDFKISRGSMPRNPLKTHAFGVPYTPLIHKWLRGP
jgi:hypothetical protein